MKQIFYTLWFVLTAVGIGIAFLMLSVSLNWISVAVLAIVLFYAFCFFRLLRVCYGQTAFADETGKWYWWSWILLSVALVLIKSGATTMMTGEYLSKSERGGRLSMTSLLNWMGDVIGPWLPGLIILAIGVLLFVICARNIIRYVSQNVGFNK